MPKIPSHRSEAGEAEDSLPSFSSDFYQHAIGEVEQRIQQAREMGDEAKVQDLTTTLVSYQHELETALDREDREARKLHCGDSDAPGFQFRCSTIGKGARRRLEDQREHCRSLLGDRLIEEALIRILVEVENDCTLLPERHGEFWLRFISRLRRLPEEFLHSWRVLCYEERGHRLIERPHADPLLRLIMQTGSLPLEKAEEWCRNLRVSGQRTPSSILDWIGKDDVVDALCHGLERNSSLPSISCHLRYQWGIVRTPGSTFVNKLSENLQIRNPKA